jgi:hypothetical protein
VRIGLISGKILLKTYFRRPSCDRRKLDFTCPLVGDPKRRLLRKGNMRLLRRKK